jgi:hypothetical protein
VANMGFRRPYAIKLHVVIDGPTVFERLRSLMSVKLLDTNFYGPISRRFDFSISRRLHACMHVLMQYGHARQDHFDGGDAVLRS